jgi:hypothetical protein
MPTHEHADTALGILGSIESAVADVLDELRRPDEWGAIDSVQRLVWTAGNTAEFNERGNFRSVVVLNENDFTIFVGLAPNAGIAARGLQLPPRSYMVIPARGVTISVGAAQAGTATVIPLAVTMPFSAGTLGAFGSAAANPGFADVTDRVARVLGRTSRGVADAVQAGGRVVAPGAGASIAVLFNPPAGVYEIFVTSRTGTGSVAADDGNTELRYGGAVQAVLPGGVTIGPFRKTLDGATAVSVNATAAGTAGVPYAATIVATRLE